MCRVRRSALYLAGARLRQPLFWVPQSGDIGMGVSILSYDGNVQFGLMTDHKLVPDPQSIVDRFASEFDKFLMLVLDGALGAARRSRRGGRGTGEGVAVRGPGLPPPGPLAPAVGVASVRRFPGRLEVEPFHGVGRSAGHRFFAESVDVLGARATEQQNEAVGVLGAGNR